MRDSATLFVGAGKIEAALARAAGGRRHQLAPYTQAAAALAALPPAATLLIDPRRITLGLRAARAGRRA